MCSSFLIHCFEGAAGPAKIFEVHEVSAGGGGGASWGGLQYYDWGC